MSTHRGMGWFCLVVLAAITINLATQGRQSEGQQKVGKKKAAKQKVGQQESPVLRLVVMQKYKADAKPEQIEAYIRNFQELPKRIDSILSFEWGPNKHPERGGNKGMTHCFVLTFKDEAGLAIYEPHPEHAKNGELLKPIFEDGLVFNYWTQEK